MSSLNDKVTISETITGHTYTDRLRGATALDTTGNMVLWEGGFRLVPKNQELAVYGDTVVAAKLCRDWLNAGLSKRAWTTIIQSVATNANLAQVGFAAGLHACINLNDGTATVSTATMATTVEAILGAIHLDGGNEAMAAAMERIGLTHDLLVQAALFKMQETGSEGLDGEFVLTDFRRTSPTKHEWSAAKQKETRSAEVCLDNGICVRDAKGKQWKWALA